LALASTLVEAKAEMDAAAKAARQKAKAAQPTSKPDASSAKKEEAAAAVSAPADTTPSLFSAQQAADPGNPVGGSERDTTP